jgi:hypothetical protein
LFGEVVARLVVAVDGVFDFGDLGVGGVGGAGAVLGVPQVEVGPMLGQDPVIKRVTSGGDAEDVVVPEAGGAVLEGRNFYGGEMKLVRH